MRNNLNITKLELPTIQSSMISAFKLSSSCLCSEEAMEMMDAATTLVIDVRKADCSKKYTSIKNTLRLPFDSIDIVSKFLDNSLSLPKKSNILHFIFVCDHGYRSENIARQLESKGVEGVYHLCGGYSHHEIELAQNPAFLKGSLRDQGLAA